MILRNRVIRFGEQSDSVRLLHRALTALGYSIDDDEQRGNRAGETSLKAILQLQKAHGIDPRPPRESGGLLLDAKIREILADALTQKGLTNPSEALRIQGKVSDPERRPLSGLDVTVYAINLRGLGLLGEGVEFIEKLAPETGFLAAGEGVTDSDGAYRVSMPDWLFEDGDRFGNELVVLVSEQSGQLNRVVGRTAVIHANRYRKTGVIDRTDIMATPSRPDTEYARLALSLEPEIKESGIRLGQLSGKSEQLEFIASKSGADRAAVQAAADVDAFAANWPDEDREVLYGMVRAGLQLEPDKVGKQSDERLKTLLREAVDYKLIQQHDDLDLDKLSGRLQKTAVTAQLDMKHPKLGGNLDSFLSAALPEKRERVEFMVAVNRFDGKDGEEFWHKYLPRQPAFRDRPDLVKNLLVTQQLTLLTGNHPPLVKLLQGEMGITSIAKLIELDSDHWQRLIKQSGVPEAVQGKNEKERAVRYLASIEQLLDASFPGMRIAGDILKGGLKINDSVVAKTAVMVLSKEDRDLSAINIDSLEREIEDLAGNKSMVATRELKRIQRLYQASPDRKSLAVMFNAGLGSSHEIAAIPQKSFVKSYGGQVGGEKVAYAIHQRASYVSARAEMAAMHILEYTDFIAPGVVLKNPNIGKVLSERLPNYASLFGSPDICQCKHCSSVYSPSAYFVDLMRFLKNSAINDNGESPLDMLSKRRPDLGHMLLTCENTHTLIPYVDLVNEIMEYFTVHDSLAGFIGYDTGDTEAEALQANPQNTDPAAYRILSQEVYPFGLPYHQPLDVIRSFSKKLSTSRLAIMKAVNPEPDAIEQRAMDAEHLGLSETQFAILTGELLDGTASVRPVHEYYGYGAAGSLENLSNVRELMARSGVTYEELVSLVETRFLNPGQYALNFLDAVFTGSSLSGQELYDRLGLIASANLQSNNDHEISQALSDYSTATGTLITPPEFDIWVAAFFSDFQGVVTLYEPESRCDLDSTSLRTMESLYAGGGTSGIPEAFWSRYHRFVRLWRKLGWTAHELDLILNSLGYADITSETLEDLAAVLELSQESKLEHNKLATFWGDIDTQGEKHLYGKLFLNRGAQGIDDAFQPDGWGNYLTSNTTLLADHESAILAAFRISADDLDLILASAEVIEGGVRRPIDFAVDTLDMPNLSTLYRFVTFAKALKLKVADLVRLIDLFETYPFSTWDRDAGVYNNVDPTVTLQFFHTCKDVLESGFKSATLEYIVDGVVDESSTIALDGSGALDALTNLRAVYNSIENDHPDVLEEPTVTAVRDKLTLTFGADAVGELLEIAEGTVVHETLADANLDVVIPDNLAERYSYTKGSGRLVCVGVMSDDDRAVLKGLPDTNASFTDAVDALYALPESVIADNFDGVFGDLPLANALLLDHPAQAEPLDLEDKLEFIYQQFIPIIKDKLRREALTQEVVALTGVSAEMASLLFEPHAETLLDASSVQGLSASYFTDNAWGAIGILDIDPEVDFAWADGSPDPSIPAAGFSARWQAMLAPEVTGEHTLIVNVPDSDDAFFLYLNDELVVDKASGEAMTSKEVVIELNATDLYLLRLDYSQSAQNAGISLGWKTVGSEPTVIPSSALYPEDAATVFVDTLEVIYRAALFAGGFSLSENDVQHLMVYGADFDDIDLMALTPEDWERIYHYTRLRDKTPQNHALLTDIFEAASNATADLEDIKALVVDATGWDEVAVDFAVDSIFGLDVDDFANADMLSRVGDIVELVRKTGIAVDTVDAWGQPESDFDSLNALAQELKDAVRAKYNEEDWLSLAGEVNDGIRERQKQALIQHLLTKPAIKSWGATNADGLYEYFLIDVQMMPCMDTSRVVQASAAIQLFVQRTLLNLESDVNGGNQHGVAPGAIDRERWDWMKNYRVWEANRKVFLYPENWLEPEWRMDRSVFFKDLESYLAQNDISDRNVETAFRNYLSSLAMVSHLDVVASHEEKYSSGELKYLHVFARTQSPPHRYFYRRWNEFGKWSGWEPVDVEIRATNDGNNSGVHLTPVVWKGRMFIFWLDLNEKLIEKGDKNESVETKATQSVATMEPRREWETRLGWSEYVEGKWQPAHLSNEYTVIAGGIGPRAYLSLQSYIYPDTNQLRLTIWNHQHFSHQAYFDLSDIEAPIHVSTPEAIWVPDASSHYWSTYLSFFQKRSLTNVLDLKGNTYLEAYNRHNLLNPANIERNENRLVSPFFYSDRWRSYFVKPVSIKIVDWIRRPDIVRPLDPVIVDVPWQEPDVPWVDPPIPDDPVFGGGWGPDIDPAPDTQPTLGGGDIAGPRTGGLTQAGVTRIGEAKMPTILVGKDAMQGFPAEGFMRRADALGGTAKPVVLMMKSEARGQSGQQARAMSMPMKIDGGGQPAARKAIYADKLAGSFSGTGFGADMAAGKFLWEIKTRNETGLEFHTFYHPFSADYVLRMNRDGLDGLMASDTELESDEGATFTAQYHPNFTDGLVQKPSNFIERTLFKENVCFDVYGANSLYNWELFYHAPLYIATRLSKNGQYEAAMRWFHFIFDPTTDEESEIGQEETARFWKVLPFKTTAAESLDSWFRELGASSDSENAIIAEWRDNPFDPHLVASNRPLSYMKHTVVKYIENLIDWGDSLFRQFTRESVYEAQQLYVMASQILGPRPENIPRRGTVSAESYLTLETRWDDFSNALVELENLFPYSSDVNPVSGSPGNSLLGLGSTLYFCIPHNDKLMSYWDTVAERLFNIRHCRDINGVERTLALFPPPIDPAALVKARSQGLSIGSILADLSSPPPIYRFRYLIQKANEFCSDLVGLGSALLGALEKKDSEALARLRASHETATRELITAVRERNILEARANLENIQKGREMAKARAQHYLGMLGVDEFEIPDAPSLDTANLNVDSQLPADTAIAELLPDVDTALEDAGGGLKLIGKEIEDLNKSEAAKWVNAGATLVHAIGAGLKLIPQINGEGEPVGVGVSGGFGGVQLGGGADSLGKLAEMVAGWLTAEAAMASKVAGYIRREQDWTLQVNQAAREIIEIDKQITAAEIRVSVAEKELENHLHSIEQAEEVERFLEDKFTNEELYQWMKEQLSSVFRQSYNLAYEMAKKAEKAYHYERGTDAASFIEYGYWDNGQKGLTSGEKLRLALRQMEKSFIDENHRELEISKPVSLALLDPLALVELRETGKCYVSLPETLFDMDFQGHYFRRIKSVSLTIPCIVGPNTSVSCSLRLLSNTYRTNTAMNSEGNYEHENDEGLLIEDSRFRTQYVPVTGIATSTGQVDRGLFEFNFQDNRYLPFEGAGAVSDWMIELTTESDLRQFDYDTIADVILRVDYTAREAGGLFKEKVLDYLDEFLANAADLSDQPLMNMVSLTHNHPTEWHRWLNPQGDADQEMVFTVGVAAFPFFTRHWDIEVQKIDVFAKCSGAGDYHLHLAYENEDSTFTESDQIAMAENAAYGGIHKATINVTDAGLNLDDLSVARSLKLKLKHNGDVDFRSLDADEVSAVYVVFHYRLG